MAGDGVWMKWWWRCGGCGAWEVQDQARGGEGGLGLR